MAHPVRQGMPLLLAGIASLAGARGAAAEPVRQPKIVVLPVKVDPAIRSRVPSILDDHLLLAFQQRGGFEVISIEDVNTLVGYEQQKEVAGCDDARCVAEIGGALGADLLAVFRLAPVGSEWGWTSKLFDIKNVRVVGRVSSYVDDDPRDLLESVPDVVGKLLKTIPPALLASLTSSPAAKPTTPPPAATAAPATAPPPSPRVETASTTASPESSAAPTPPPAGVVPVAPEGPTASASVPAAGLGWRLKAAIGAGGLAVVAASGAFYFGYQASAAVGRRYSATTPEKYDSAKRSARQNASISTISAICAGVLATAGTGLGAWAWFGREGAGSGAGPAGATTTIGFGFPID